MWNTLAGESEWMALSGASARYTADWDNFTGSNCIGTNCIGNKFHWEQIPLGQISVGANFSGRNYIGTKFLARRGQWLECTLGADDILSVWLPSIWRRRLPACLAASLVQSRTHGWRPSAARNRRYNCVEGAIGNSVAPLHRELALHMVP